MKSQRIANMAALTHLVWSSLVYFYSLAGNSHEWWPIFLIYIRWPAGIVFEQLSQQLSGVTATGNPTDKQFILNDQIAGGLYIVGGAVWLWVVFFSISWLLSQQGGAQRQ